VTELLGESDVVVRGWSVEQVGRWLRGEVEVVV
jgi:hypothetical protein